MYETSDQVSRILHWLIDHSKTTNTKLSMLLERSLSASLNASFWFSSRWEIVVKNMATPYFVHAVSLRPSDTDIATAVKGALPGRYFSSRLHTSLPFHPFPSNTFDLAFTPYTK